MHSGEIEYALGNLDGNPVYAWTRAGPPGVAADAGLLRPVHQAWRPQRRGLPAWPAVRASKGGLLRQTIDAQTRTEVDHGAARQAFLQAYFATHGRMPGLNAGRRAWPPSHGGLLKTHRGDDHSGGRAARRLQIIVVVEPKSALDRMPWVDRADRDGLNAAKRGGSITLQSVAGMDNGTMRFPKAPVMAAPRPDNEVPRLARLRALVGARYRARTVVRQSGASRGAGGRGADGRGQPDRCRAAVDQGQRWHGR